MAALERESREAAHEHQLSSVVSLLRQARAMGAVCIEVNDAIEPREGATHEIERGDVVRREHEIVLEEIADRGAQLFEKQPLRPQDVLGDPNVVGTGMHVTSREVLAKNGKARRDLRLFGPPDPAVPVDGAVQEEMNAPRFDPGLLCREAGEELAEIMRTVEGDDRDRRRAPDLAQPTGCARQDHLRDCGGHTGIAVLPGCLRPAAEPAKLACPGQLQGKISRDGVVALLTK